MKEHIFYQTLLAPRKRVYVFKKAVHSWQLGPKAKMSERIVKQAKRQKIAKESLYHKAHTQFHNVQCSK